MSITTSLTVNGVKRTIALDDPRVTLLDLLRERQAGIEPASIDDDGAGAALPAVAALLGTGQMKAFAKQVEQRDPGVIERDRPLHAVHSETRRDAHAVLRRERWF